MTTRPQEGRLAAVLGPTNTGKTHYAIERMAAHASGMIGLPLRLLAREVYDRLVALKGRSRVALMTGEEKIVSDQAAYYCCTVEAMPATRPVDFVAIDEVQMAADPQRGHVFTDRLLHCRGRFETLLLGAETIRPHIERLFPDVEILTRPRFSALTHNKPVKLSRLPTRSAVVAFSADDVYALAELIRRQRGGTAIVMGALSPRTRNAQVALYQSGDVDFLVATDAIGMGLNMDIGHVAFAGLSKFDGLRVRPLTAAEIGQIAGRAGRYQREGSFSTLAGDEPMDDRVIQQVENHRFAPLKTLQWRNARLDFHSLDRLIASLERPARIDGLHRVRHALDLKVLKILAEDRDIQARARHADQVRLLWEVCQIPDFRRLSETDHIALLKRIHADLSGPEGVISHRWLSEQVSRLDNSAGEIDTLAARIANIRTWTYVSHRSGWLTDPGHWSHVTRVVEDRLSDALHERLTQRFVDRRTSVLMRQLRQAGTLQVIIDDDNRVMVEDQPIGRLEGFSFRVEAGAAREEQAALNHAAADALKVEITRRAKLFGNVGYKTLTINVDQGLSRPRLMWEGHPIAVIDDGGAPLALKVKPVAGSLLSEANADLVVGKAQEWLAQRIDDKLGPLLKLARELAGEADIPEGVAPLAGMTRGIAYRLLENLGVLPREEVAQDLKQLDQDQRKILRRFHVRIGMTSLYIPILLKPHAVELRLIVWALGNIGAERRDALPPIPPPGMVWVDLPEGFAPAVLKDFYQISGFRVTGKKAVRIDMLERLADAVRPLGQGGAEFEVTPEIMGLVGLSGADFAEVMAFLNYRGEARMVSKPAAPPPAVDAGSDAAGDGAGDASDAMAAAPEPEAPTDQAEAPAAAMSVEPAAGEADGAAAAPDSEPALVERYFFRWTPPKRKPRGDHSKGAAKKRRAQTGSDKAGHDASGRAAGKSKQPKRSAQKPHKIHTPKPVRDKPIDPDSPFAALAGLKESLAQKK